MNTCAEDKQMELPQIELLQIELLIGTYTNGESRGVYRTLFTPGAFTPNTFTPRRATLSPPQLVFETENPSFLAMEHGSKHVYAVNEVADGKIVALSWLPTKQKFQQLGEASSLGSYPCYLNFHPGKQLLSVANYGSGTVGVYGLEEHNIHQPPIARIQHEENSAGKQRAAHAHWVGWHPRKDQFFAVDLGLNRVKHTSPLSTKTQSQVAIQLQPKDGPRHMVFHPQLDLAYLVNEYANTVAVLDVNADGTMALRKTHTTLPRDFTGHSQAAHIALSRSGKYLYVSNRGYNSIAVFALGQDGALSPMQIFPLKGNWPRHFSILQKDKFMVIANQKSASIEVAKIQDDGKISESFTALKIDQPAFVAPWR